jgi:uncharacterized phage protein gp47/JayE
MALTFYKIKQLLDAAKAELRGAIAGIGTEDGSDGSLLLQIAARLLQGGQVAAKHVYDQLLPSTADASNRDRMADYYGLSFEKAATPARGLLLLTGWTGTNVAAGTVVSFPAACFADGVARSYRLLEDASIRDSAEEWAATIFAGSNEWKMRVAHASQPPYGLHGIEPKEAVRVRYGAGDDDFVLTAIRRVNPLDQTIELYSPLPSRPVAAQTVVNTWVIESQPHGGVVVAAECVVAGKIGNAGQGRTGFTFVPHSDSVSVGEALIIEMAGGGDAVVGTDADEARQVRLIEDTAAGFPSLGNMAHWRELAIQCPDVDIDDAVVYQHARGPGTIDIVAIGRSGRMNPASFPGARTDFTHGFNGRRIGEVQAARIEAWCKSKASYHDDIKVRSVEYEYLGEDQVEDVWNSTEFFRSTPCLNLEIAPQEGYGPDCGVALAPINPHTDRESNGNVRLYPSTNTGTGLATDFVDASLAPGQRVWVQLKTVSQPLTGLNSIGAPMITVVTTITSVDRGRLFVTVPDLDKADGGAGSSFGVYFGAYILAWGPAGPLTQPIIDAVYDYYDQLGPGGYLEPPKDPTYVRQFQPAVSAVAVHPGLSLSRWPPEGRRWAGGFRLNELWSRFMAIKGVKSVGSGFHEFDPLPFHTLALRGVTPRYV